ncbi:hypothetical protein ACFL21_01450 [Patescibacteria group bacterium]
MNMNREVLKYNLTKQLHVFKKAVKDLISNYQIDKKNISIRELLESQGLILRGSNQPNGKINLTFGSEKIEHPFYHLDFKQIINYLSENDQIVLNDKTDQFGGIGYTSNMPDSVQQMLIEFMNVSFRINYEVFFPNVYKDDKNLKLDRPIIKFLDLSIDLNDGNISYGKNAISINGNVVMYFLLALVDGYKSVFCIYEDIYNSIKQNYSKKIISGMPHDEYCHDCKRKFKNVLKRLEAPVDIVDKMIDTQNGYRLNENCDLEYP